MQRKVTPCSRFRSRTLVNLPYRGRGVAGTLKVSPETPFCCDTCDDMSTLEDKYHANVSCELKYLFGGGHTAKVPYQGVSRPKQVCSAGGIMNNHARISRYPAKRVVLLHREHAHASPGALEISQRCSTDGIHEF
jgi:hypothetical protein